MTRPTIWAPSKNPGEKNKDFSQSPLRTAKVAKKKPYFMSSLRSWRCVAPLRETLRLPYPVMNARCVFHHCWWARGPIPAGRNLPHACLVLLSASALLAQTALEIDPAQSKVEFTVGSTLHTVHGSFRLKRGTVRFDPATGKASGELVVDATSGDSGNDARDRRMHKDILQSGRYPEIVFRPDRVEGKVAAEGASQVQLHGVFSIHGAEHEMTVPVDVQAAGGQYTSTAHFVVPYIQWGLKNPSTFLLRVGDKVEIAVHTSARAAR